MSNLTRYGVANMDQLLDRITRNSVGMDEYFDNIFGTAQGNYPPYNLIQESNTRSRLEIALAGFKKDEVNVYTEYGKLHVEGSKPTKEDLPTEEQFFHRGLAQRSFKRSWTVAEDTKVTDVTFEDGLLVVKLGKVIPEHHARKDYLS